MSLNNKMGKAHEEFLVKLLGGRKTKASGSQWTDQMDGRHNRREREFAFAWDGKSTRSKSVGVTRAMWEKAKEQAGGERPLLPLRFYDTDKLDVGLDLVVLSLDDFAEMLERVNVVERQEVVRVFRQTARDGDPGSTIVIRGGVVSRTTAVTIMKCIDLSSVLIDSVAHHGPVEIYVDNVLWHRQVGS